MQIDGVAARIEYSAPQDVRDVISSLGRTEDVRFSPNYRRLAVAEFFKNKVAIFDISITTSGNSKHITLTSAHEISSSHLKLPHGIDFIDDEKRPGVRLAEDRTAAFLNAMTDQFASTFRGCLEFDLRRNPSLIDGPKQDMIKAVLDSVQDLLKLTLERRLHGPNRVA